MIRLKVALFSIGMSILFAGCAVQKTVLITSEPDQAKVFINGEDIGITSLTQTFDFTQVSEYEVILKKEKYRDKKVIIQYNPADKKEYSVVLEKIEKTVIITSEPDSATVFINGNESGITPLTTSLLFDDIKEYNIVAKHEGYEDGSLAITFAPEDVTDYHLDLKKKEAVFIELVSFEPKTTNKGVKLAAVRKPTVAYLETIERSPNVKSVTRVTSNEDETLQIGPPVLSPIKDVLVYRETIEEEDGSSFSNIWKTNIGSFGKTRVTFGKWNDLFPSFTTDGEFLIFSSNRTSPNSTLWRINIEGGGGITNITNTIAEDYAPSVGKVGETDELITYTSNPYGAEESQIWSIGMNGNLPTMLREGESPCISPDGTKILFVRKDKITKKKQLWTMNINGMEETQLTQNVDYDVKEPKWSPDGQWIVYTSNEGVNSKKLKNDDIWLMTKDGSKKTQLTTNGSIDDSPCWDYSGTYIYLRSNRGGVWNIWRFEPVMPR